MKIVIFGGGRVGKTLAQLLIQHKYDITIIDSGKEICDMLANELSCKIVCAEGTDPDLLDQLELHESDYVFAVTGNEEVNFLLAVYAKSVKAKRVICRGSEAKYSKLMERLGVEPLTPELTVGRELANIVMNPVLSLMLDPAYSNIELLEQEVKGPLVGKSVGQVGKKKDFTIGSIFHDGKFFYPEPDFVLQKGMKIVVIKHKL